MQFLGFSYLFEVEPLQGRRDGCFDSFSTDSSRLCTHSFACTRTKSFRHVHISYSRQEIKYFWWSHVTARISLDLPTFLQMPRNMAQRHQTLFPRRTSGHAHQRGKRVCLARLKLLLVFGESSIRLFQMLK